MINLRHTCRGRASSGWPPWKDLHSFEDVAQVEALMLASYVVTLLTLLGGGHVSTTVWWCSANVVTRAAATCPYEGPHLPGCFGSEHHLQ